MEITQLQVLGIILVIFGIYGLIKGEIEWSVTDDSGSELRMGSYKYKLTPDKVFASGVWKGKLIRPMCAICTVAGLILIFIYTGEKIAFTL